MRNLMIASVLLMVNMTFIFGQAKSETEKKQIITLLDDFNKAAANADFNEYFDFFAEESSFIGTDAKETWNKKEFMNWAKPFFDKKTTWSFTSLKRNIYLNKDQNFAWFDEILNTQMRLCRGSGVLEKINGVWKIKQYVLSMTVPNEITEKVVEEKILIEDAFIEKLNSVK